jgi:hypothetical protein
MRTRRTWRKTLSGMTVPSPARVHIRWMGNCGVRLGSTQCCFQAHGSQQTAVLRRYTLGTFVVELQKEVAESDFRSGACFAKPTAQYGYGAAGMGSSGARQPLVPVKTNVGGPAQLSSVAHTIIIAFLTSQHQRYHQQYSCVHV